MRASLSLVKLALLLLALLAIGALALAEPPKLFVAEVVVWRAGGAPTSQFLLLEWRGGCRLELKPPEDSVALLVRVDSSTPFKPYALAIDGTSIVPRASEGVVLVEDFAWLNFTKLGFVPKAVAVTFAEYPAKPPVYALSERGGERVWGYVVSALLRNASCVDSLTGLKLTILSEEALTIPLAVGNVTLYSVAILAADPLQPLLDRLRGVAVELKVTALYYSELRKAPGAAYVYANRPAGCRVELSGYAKAEDALGRAFPNNPTLLRPLPGFGAALGACSLEVENPGPYDYVVGGWRIAAGSSAAISIPHSSGAVAALAYRKGVLAYNLSLYGYAPKLRLPAYSYSVYVSVVDAKGEPVRNATILLAGAGNALRELAAAVNGACVFSDIPPGEYVVSAVVGEREVGRASAKVERGDAYVELNTSLVDFEITVTYPNGGKVAGFTITLRGDGAQYVSSEVGGRAIFEDVPAGRYSYVVRKGDVTLAEGIIGVEASRSGYVIVADVSKVFVKVVDLLGRPVPNARIEVKGPVSATATTDSGGTAALDLKPGVYEVAVPELGLRASLEVKSGGAQTTLVYVPRRAYLVAAGALAVAALAIAVSRRKGSEVEVLELEGDEE